MVMPQIALTWDPLKGSICYFHTCTRKKIKVALTWAPLANKKSPAQPLLLLRQTKLLYPPSSQSFFQHRHRSPLLSLVRFPSNPMKSRLTFTGSGSASTGSCKSSALLLTHAPGREWYTFVPLFFFAAPTSSRLHLGGGGPVFLLVVAEVNYGGASSNIRQALVARRAQPPHRRSR